MSWRVVEQKEIRRIKKNKNDYELIRQFVIIKKVWIFLFRVDIHLLDEDANRVVFNTREAAEKFLEELENE